MFDPTTRLMSASTHRAELHRTAPFPRPARRARVARRPLASWFAGRRRRPTEGIVVLAGRPG